MMPWNVGRILRTFKIKKNKDAMNPSVFVLDEPTASIDPENEHLIQEAISELTYGKTIITIAHRLATIENADQGTGGRLADLAEKERKPL